MTRDSGARVSMAGSSGDWQRVNTSVAIPRSLKAVQTSRTYTLRPPLAFSPGEAVGDVCMEITASRLEAGRLEIRALRSATIGRSRVKPAPRDAAEPRP